MVQPRCHKRSRVPRRPFDKDRLIEEMKLVGAYGLKNKKELWTIQKICDDTKRRARDLLISTEEKEIIVHGRNLLNGLVKSGIFSDVDLKDKSDIIKNLEKVLDLTPNKFLERRLQHRVFEAGIARSVHHARVLIYQRQISIKGKIVNKPGFIVSAENEGYIEAASNSALGGHKLGRKKKKMKKSDDEEREE